MFSKYRIQLSLGCFVAALAVPVAATEEVKPAIPGTYEVLVCDSTCNFESQHNYAVRGVLVLMPTAFDEKKVAIPQRVEFEYGYSLIGITNGCFVLTKLREGQTYAGITPVGWTRWSGNPDGISFELYQSPDAWYVAWVKLTTSGFAGTGASSGGVGDGPGWPPDRILGHRIGPPDLQRCIEAAKQIGKRK